MTVEALVGVDGALIIVGAKIILCHTLLIHIVARTEGSGTFKVLQGEVVIIEP